MIPTHLNLSAFDDECVQNQGVTPAGSGYSPKGGAAEASPAEPSIPNANGFPHGRLIVGALLGYFLIGPALMIGIWLLIGWFRS